MSLQLNLSLSKNKKWTPSVLQPHISLWLDAYDSSTLTLSSTSVTQWNDKSGNYNNVSQSDSLKKPTYNATGFNLRPCLTFDYSNTQFLSTDVYKANLDTAQASIFFVAKRGSGAGNMCVCGNRLAAGRIVRTTATPSIVYANINGGTLTINDTITSNFVSSSVYNNSSSMIYGNVNGASLTNATGAYLSDNVCLFAIGAQGGTTPNEPFNGDIAEFIYLKTAVDLNIIQKIEGYLAWKWGLVLNLPVNHPYKTKIPLI